MFDKNQLQRTLQRYQGLYQTAEVAYGTVRDYCDSCDHIPVLSNYQGDLKDFQRPWTVKAILGNCPPGSKLLEIGAGEPIVAQMLAELGYDVSVIDPYDGSAGGPHEFDQFRRIYTDVKMQQGLFPGGMPGSESGRFDCIYSISVLEHISEPALSEMFEGIRTFLKPKGVSVHSIDHITEGKGVEFHRKNLAGILKHQSKLNGTGEYAETQLDELDRRLREDLETFYLSPTGHNLWRGRTPYEQFPFRRVVTVLCCVRSSRGSLKRT